MIRYRVLTGLLALLGLPLIASAFTVDGYLKDWGKGSYWTTPNPTTQLPSSTPRYTASWNNASLSWYHNSLSEKRFDAADPRYVATQWDQTNDHITLPSVLKRPNYVGGEWNDIEGLYFYLTKDATNGHKYLNWALSTSYADTDSGANLALERNNKAWYGKAAGQAAAKWHTSLASGGDGKINPKTGKFSNNYDHVYSRHPVFAIDLDGNSNSAKGSYEYALVLAPNQHDTAGNTTVNSISDQAELWKIRSTDPSGAWIKANAYDQAYADFDATQASRLVSGNGLSQRFLTTITETNDMQWGGKQKSGLGQARNWLWEGSMDLGKTGEAYGDFQDTSKMLVQYSLWSGFDVVNAKDPPFSTPNPEPSSWALLACTALAGMFIARRRRQA